jgi:DNA-binding GntR family transcriptional regulator
VPVHVTPARRAVALLAAAEQLNNRSRSGRLLLRFSPQNADQIFLVLDALSIWAGKS